MIDIDNVEWDKFVLAKSGRAVKLLYNKEPVQFCTSSLYSPFGVKSLDKDWSTFTEYNIDCSLNNAQTGNAASFKEYIDKLDKKLQELAQQQSDIFTKSNGGDFVYSPILRENGTYPRLMKLQMTRDKNGNFTSVVFDESKNKIMIDESNINDILSKGKVFKCIIECAKIWSFNGKVGSIWNIVQLKLSERAVAKSVGPADYSKLMISD
ncbi:MAG: hypothetical protein EBU90_16170 [Proteobacteria bacterium]|nr:hypothetical protein [Pseudomonadota bacterium]NBP15325.1 hypothetical protein [bacterium]